MIYPIRRQHLFGLLLILIVGGILRFNDLAISEFWYDEAVLSALAQDMATGKSFPLLGMLSSAQVPNPPTGVYVLAIPFFFSSNPLLAVGFIALLNVAGIALLWLFAYRYFGPLIAFLSGLIYAVSPWAVLYSRKIWGQEIHTPFLLAGLLIGFYGFLEGKRWAQIVCLPILFFAMQIHFAAWALLPAYVWLVWMGRKRVHWWALGISIVLALLCLAPFVIGLTQIRIPERLDNEADAGITALPLQHIVWLATGLGMGESYALPANTEFIAQYPVVGLLWLAAIPLLCLGSWRVWKRSPSLAIFLLLWGFLPPITLMSGLYKSQTHYFIPCIPIYCLLIGEGAAWVTRQRVSRLQLRPLALSLLGIVAITQVIHWRSYLNTVDTVNTAFTTPLHYMLEISEALEDDVLLMAGTLEQVMPLQWSPLVYDRTSCLREAVIAEGGVAVLPQHPFQVLRAPGAAPYEFASLYQSDAQIVFPLRPGEGEYTLDTISHPPQWMSPELTSIEPAQFDTGAILEGYQFAENRLYLSWSLRVQAARDYQYFAHLLDAGEQRIAQRDASFYPGRYWCAGDRIVTWIGLERPVEATTLRIGMYRLDNDAITGSNIIDDAGNAAAPWVDIALLEVD